MEESNESCALLTVSENESHELHLPVKRRQGRRFHRFRISSPKAKTSWTFYGCISKLCKPLLCSFLVGIIIWISALTWAALQLRIEMQTLRNITQTVSAGYEGMPDSIQKCHSLTSQLEKNQTKIINQLQKVAQRLTNFSNMISGIQADLSKVEKKLDESPPQLNVPNTLQTLTTNVASFRDQIDDLQSKAVSIVKEQIHIKTLVDSIDANVTSVYKDLQDLRKHYMGKSPLSDQPNVEGIVNLVKEKIHPEISSVNNTLRNEMKWLSDELHKAQKTISNLTDQSEFCQSHIWTIHDTLKDLNGLRNTISNYTSEWDELAEETKSLQSNITKFWTCCLQNKYLFNEEPTTGLPAISASEMTSSTTQMIHNITVT